MFRRLKQLFCQHLFYSYAQHEPHYMSEGDKYHDRRSIHYYHLCTKCGYKMESVSKWNNDAVRMSMMLRPQRTEETKEESS